MSNLMLSCPTLAIILRYEATRQHFHDFIGCYKDDERLLYFMQYDGVAGINQPLLFGRFGLENFQQDLEIVPSLRFIQNIPAKMQADHLTNLMSHLGAQDSTVIYRGKKRSCLITCGNNQMNADNSSGLIIVPVFTLRGQEIEFSASSQQDRSMLPFVTALRIRERFHAILDPLPLGTISSVKLPEFQYKARIIIPKTVYVTGIPYKARRAELFEFIRQIVRGIKKVSILTRKSGSRYAFVKFFTEEDAKTVIGQSRGCHGIVLRSKRLQISQAYRTKVLSNPAGYY